jgi:UDP-glucose-4-epimerase GalE
MTVLVTGGAGYIGSHVVRALARIGRSTVVLDNLDTGEAESVRGTKLIRGDISDEQLVRQICRDHRVSAVMHFAAHKNVGESMRLPGKYIRNNVGGTAALLHSATSEGVNRFIFSSSCSVYGTPSVLPVDESATIQPESAYAESKAMAERVFDWYRLSHGARTGTLRYFNAAGASSDSTIGEQFDSKNLIPRLIKATLLGGPPVEIYGGDYDTPDGTCIRDYVHVEELAVAHVRALDVVESEACDLVLNVGTGVGTSVLDVVRALEVASRRTVPTTVAPKRPGDPAAVFANVSRLVECLSWKPKSSIYEIVESAWKWHTR